MRLTATTAARHRVRRVIESGRGRPPSAGDVVVAFPRVLVATGSAGYGHVRAAQALPAALRTRHPRLDVAEVDALAVTARWYGWTYRKAYVRLVDHHPILWRALYESTDRRTSSLAHALTVLG